MFAKSETRINSNINLHCELDCLCRHHEHDARVDCNSMGNKFLWRRWAVCLMLLLSLQLAYDMPALKIKNDTEARQLFVQNITSQSGEDMTPIYPRGTTICHLNVTTLGTIEANKTALHLERVEKQHLWVKWGGFYFPKYCQARHKVAILIPFRDRETNLVIFLHHIHPFLKKQLIQYRIFVVEQYGSGKFNKGMLYNIGFLESQQFGDWQCFIFHDVDLLPLDERILYNCPRKPTHMSAAVENHGYELLYPQLFGGVTALTVEQFKAVNGYSNFYWNWGSEDDDMFIRLQASRFPVVRYSRTIARYAALPHSPTAVNENRWATFDKSKETLQNRGFEYSQIQIAKSH